MNNYSISQQVRMIRAALGMSQLELARKAKIAPATLSGVERGDDVKVSTLIRIAAALGKELSVNLE